MCVKSIHFVVQDFSPVYKCDCECRDGQLNGYKNDFKFQLLIASLLAVVVFVKFRVV